jgi:hypothetical protein
LIFDKISDSYGAYLTGTGKQCLHDHIAEICLESDRDRAWLALPHFNQVRDKAEQLIDIFQKFHKTTGKTQSTNTPTENTTATNSQPTKTIFITHKAEI